MLPIAHIKSLANNINSMLCVVVNLSFTKPPSRSATVGQRAAEQSLDENTGMMTRPGGSVSSHNPPVWHNFHMGIRLVLSWCPTDLYPRRCCCHLLFSESPAHSVSHSFFIQYRHVLCNVERSLKILWLVF